ncbi:MAG: FemAB family PEP-CTERM system-associated protein [Planctomycetes bacterium]|nr:FemAB family PEP-CTERM system-associated protein [Planctomycetota bacterium]
MTVSAFVSVIIPISNPSCDVETLVRGYSEPLGEAGYAFELVFVLDGVHGGVLQRLQELNDPHVKIVRLQGDGLGESIALSAGAARARGGFIVQVPQYLQIHPEEIVKVVRALETGADFVATWRHPRVDPWLNRVQSRLFNLVLRAVMGVHFHDLNSSVRGMRRNVLDEVNVYGEMFRFLPVLAQRQGFHVVEVKVRHREEQGTRFAFYGIGVYVRRVLDILAISFLTRFTQKPLRFFGILGVLSILLGIAISVDPIVQKIVENESLKDRPIFVLGAILVAFGVQLIGFGLVGEIIIFTQAGQMRDYKIDELLEGGSGEGGGVEPMVEEEAPVRPRPDVPPRVRELLPGEDARWDSYVRESAQGSFFHLTGWRRVVEETFGHEAHYLVCEADRAWQGVLPLFWVKSPFIGRQLISLPYAVYGGVLADDEVSQQLLLDAASDYGRRVKAGYLELRHFSERPGERLGYDLYVTFRKELPADPADVLPSIPKKARAEVRRARDKFGMTIETSDDVALFFNLFSEEKRRLGTPSLPLRWFQNIREEFGRQVVLHVVRDPEGQAMCSVMSFLFRDAVYAYYSGSRIAARGKGVSDFAYCQIMEWAIANGYRVFDFGRSRRETGAAKFKENMGFDAMPLHYEFVMLRDDAKLPNFHPSNPKLEGPRKLWSKLPPFVTSRVGGRLSRYLP